MSIVIFDYRDRYSYMVLIGRGLNPRPNQQGDSKPGVNASPLFSENDADNLKVRTNARE